MASVNPAVRAFRALLRAQRITFEGDLINRNSAKQHTKKLFLENKNVTDPEKINELINVAYDAEKIIRQNVVQGVRKATSDAENKPVFELKIREETEKGDNNKRFGEINLVVSKNFGFYCDTRGRDNMKSESEQVVNIPPNTWGILEAEKPLSTVYLNKIPTQISGVSNTIIQGVIAPSASSLKYWFGRGSDCDVTIKFSDQISKKHCCIFRETVLNEASNEYEPIVFLENHSSNGTYVNRDKIEKGKKVQLHNGDVVKLAKNEPGKRQFDDRC
ncbi:Mitochondrial zinc maintenance protein 1, mitochondrial [Nowakowskiella sp. JEL0078]|nr:Mitochondrial zinc maintenance protein 1, mitochondrial [Nowakowskiella sp. JEL0078]